MRIKLTQEGRADLGSGTQSYNLQGPVKKIGGPWFKIYLRFQMAIAEHEAEGHLLRQGSVICTVAYP